MNKIQSGHNDQDKVAYTHTYGRGFSFKQILDLLLSLMKKEGRPETCIEVQEAMIELFFALRDTPTFVVTTVERKVPLTGANVPNNCSGIDVDRYGIRDRGIILHAPGRTYVLKVFRFRGKWQVFPAVFYESA